MLLEYVEFGERAENDDYYDGMNPFELAAQWGLEGME